MPYYAVRPTTWVNGSPDKISKAVAISMKATELCEWITVWAFNWKALSCTCLCYCFRMASKVVRNFVVKILRQKYSCGGTGPFSSASLCYALSTVLASFWVSKIVQVWSFIWKVLDSTLLQYTIFNGNRWYNFWVWGWKPEAQRF